MEVLQFVGNDEIDPLLFENSYYVAPEEKVSKPYALSLAVLTATKRDAVAKVAMHNRAHVVVIRVEEGGLVLHNLYYENELHRTHKPEAPKTAFSAKELEMAKNLVGHLTASFRSETFRTPIVKCRTIDRGKKKREEEHNCKAAS